MPQLGEWLDNLWTSKTDLIKEDPNNLGDYTPYLINRAMSYFPETIQIAQHMNTLSLLPPEVHYRLWHSLLPKGNKRYARWGKKLIPDNLKLVQDYFGCNNIRAREYLDMLSEDDIHSIQQEMELGGTTKRAPAKKKQTK
jgi:hypothetical protein